ncbi:MAG: hypothetical protein MUE85_16115 [Microscillaceae bacterium]|jgi:hypothetical protein|nr:hypothetical protein [Microscillaceae bacterium]
MSDFEKRLKERTQKIDAKLAQLDQTVSQTLQEIQELGKEVKSFAFCRKTSPNKNEKISQITK